MRVLLTGATGYIGRRLKEKLLEDENVHVRLFVRNKRKIRDKHQDRIEIYEGDTFHIESLREALEDIEVAYYLIHSMGAKGDFKELDHLSAENFLDACLKVGVKRIIYLGGLGEKQTASKHLLSRIETGEILSSKPGLVQTIWFRAGIIIGSGSASFEIIRNLVQKLPFMITPKWVHTKTQPIAVSDVLEYLSQAKDLGIKETMVVDIGSKPMSFKEMLIKASNVMGLKRRIFAVPFLTPRLSSYWLILMTPVPYRIAKALVEGLKSETIIQNENAKKYFQSLLPISYEKAISSAIKEIENNQVLSRWCDSSAKEECDIKGQEKIEAAMLSMKISNDFGQTSPEKVFASVLSIGGLDGWSKHDWLLKIMGSIDKLIGGSGLNRSRRDPYDLRIGDSLDFWKVVDLITGKRLLLVGQMKLPGKAWLEFSIEDTTLVLTASFLPKGLWGRLYWFFTKPFHVLTFSDIANSIVQRAKSLA